jgi:hypothetical protein
VIDAFSVNEQKKSPSFSRVDGLTAWQSFLLCTSYREDPVRQTYVLFGFSAGVSIQPVAVYAAWLMASFFLPS